MRALAVIGHGQSHHGA